MERHDNARIPIIEIYTDGSLKKMGTTMTFGGWAFIVTKAGDRIYYSSGYEYSTTNQRMELQAIVEALKYAQSIRRSAEKVIIYSDSAYAVNCYTQEWYVGWQHKNWRNSKGDPVANQDLWQIIIPFFDNFWYTFKKVQGHGGVFWNEECDKLAQEASQKGRLEWKGIG